MLQQRLDYANTILIAGLAGRVEMEGQLEMVGHLQLGQYNRLELVGQLQWGQWKRRLDRMQTARPRQICWLEFGRQLEFVRQLQRGQQRRLDSGGSFREGTASGQ